MGKFIDEKNIVNNTIENYNNFINEKGKFLEGSPTFVTYYSKDSKASTSDIGLGAVVEIVGSESPIKYNKINDFPLYKFEAMQLLYEYDEELGVDNSIDSSAVILPTTIKPLVDDYFSISYMNKKYLFRITNVEGSSLASKFFYKIEFSLSSSNVNILEERQISNTYDLIYDNIGTEEKAIIEESLNKYIKELENEVDKLKKFYVNNFYYKKLNIFCYNRMYDNNLHYFIYNNSLFIKNKTFLENIISKPVFDVDDSYYKTVYNFIEKGDINDMSIGYVEFPISKNNFNIFRHQKETYYGIEWIDYEENNIFENLKNSFVINSDSDKIEINIFKKYFDKDICLEDKIIDILDLLKNNKLLNNIENYFYVPCYIYILTKLIKDIINK